MECTTGFAEAERTTVATLYWEAFGPKLGRVLGPRTKALRLLGRVLRPDHAICARDGTGRLIGVAGFKTAQGALAGGGLGDLVAIYGAGALWRGAVLALIKRDIDNDRFLMDGLFVTEAARGQGVGTALLDAIAAEARARGYPAVRLDVIDTNPRARALYERHGFVAAGESRMGWLRHLFGFDRMTTMVLRLD